MWHRIGYRSKAAHAEAGFTLVEVIVSFLIFAIIATAAVAGIVSGVNVSDYTADRVAAANVAQAALQQARANPSAVIASPAPAPSQTSVGGRKFTVARTASVPTASGTSCPIGSAMPVSVIVSWHNGSDRQVRMDTVIAC